MLKNKYNSKCASCNCSLSAGEGYCFKNKTGRWQAVCESKACHTKLGILEESNQERKITEDGLVIMPFEREALPLIKSLPSAKWEPDLPGKPWRVSLKPGDLPRVLEVAKQLKLNVPESFHKQVEEGTGESRAEIQRANNKSVSGKVLYPFQKDGVKFLSLHDNGLLADEMGLGKSVQLLVALKQNDRVVIVCPASLKYNWQDEANDWRPDYKTIVCKSPKDFVFPKPGEIVIINYDILPKELSWEENKEDKGKSFSDLVEKYVPQNIRDGFSGCTVIYDEVQYLKNYKSLRGKRGKTLSYLCRCVWGASGTPLDNKATDLFGVMESCNTRPFGSWTNFVKLFNGYKNEFGGYVFGMPTPEVVERLKRVMLRRLKKDVLPDLPKKVYKNIVIDLDKKDSKALNDFTIKAALEQGLLEEDMVKKADVEYLAEALNTSELPSFSEFSKLRALLAESRIPAMLEIVEQYEESETPLIVFSDHRKPIDTLATRDGWAVITGDTDKLERRNIVKRFQNGELKGIGLTIAAGGVGLTLTRASNILFVDMNFRPSQNSQAEDRAVRIGATADHVLVMRLSSNHPLDSHMHAMLEFKTELMYQALDRINKPTEIQNTKTELREETEEEMLARMASQEKLIENAEREVVKGWSRRKLENVVERERAKSSHVPEPEIDKRRKELLRKAFEYMYSLCDGAREKDDAGFNKPDAAMAQWIARTGLGDDDDVAFRVLERMLVRYPRQLKNAWFEEIWK
jgi:SNF2 family DNA or RNA helicase